jgi:hypothetical protein
MRHLILLLMFAVAGMSAADSDLAGKFSGDWKSNGAGTGGKFQIHLDSGAGGAWKCEVTFLFGDQEVKTRNCGAKVDQGKLEASYDFDLMGNVLRSKINGQWNGKSLEGQYHTTAVEGGGAVDEGTWTAARAN